MTSPTSPELAGRALADAAEATLPGWVERSVRNRLGRDDPAVLAEARRAGVEAARSIVPPLRRLLEADIDEQTTTPLALLRGAVRFPTEVLRAAGAPPADRDDFARDRFPDDPYDLTPVSFGDIHESLVGPGIEWGAAKAWAHKRRHEVR